MMRARASRYFIGYYNFWILNFKLGVRREFSFLNLFMIEISTDKSRLDVPFIQNFLKDIYWAAGRTMDEVQTTIDASICFGLYLDGKQIGFARVITDYVVFAYVMDVFVTPEHQGKGYSTKLIQAMMDEPKLAEVKIWRLSTRDAHFLYEKFGFTPLATPERMMEKVIKR